MKTKRNPSKAYFKTARRSLYLEDLFELEFLSERGEKYASQKEAREIERMINEICLEVEELYE